MWRYTYKIQAGSEVAASLTLCHYTNCPISFGGNVTDGKSDESAACNLLEAIQERNRRERPKLVAIALRAYTDEDGRFGKIPRKILCDAIPRPSYSSGYPEGKASRLVEELLREGWLENRQTRNNGVPGIWYLKVERLDPTDDVTRMTQAVRAVNDIQESYPDPKLRRLITELLSHDES